MPTAYKSFVEAYKDLSEKIRAAGGNPLPYGDLIAGTSHDWLNFDIVELGQFAPPLAVHEYTMPNVAQQQPEQPMTEPAPTYDTSGTGLNWEDVQTALTRAIKRHADAVGRLTAPTRPDTPRPRPRVFYFGPRFVWPIILEDGRVDYALIAHLTIDDKVAATWALNVSASHSAIARTVLLASGHQPTKVLAALRGIQAATQWCIRRREGRDRQAYLMLKQQDGAARALLGETLVSNLADPWRG